MEVRNRDNDNRKKYMIYITVPSSSRKPCFDLIVVRNTSRFARNINATQILEQLRQIKVYVYFCDIDKTTQKETDMEDIEAHLLAAERESRMKSRMVTFGAKEGALNGNIKASHRLYGYKFIRGKTPQYSRLEIIESEAEVIRKIFDWYLQGYGVRKIVRLLSENKIYTRKGKEFGQNTIRGYLTNEKYKGWNVRNKFDMGKVFNKNTYAKIRNKDEWIVHNDEETKKKIPPIVSEEVFDKVQELLEGKHQRERNLGKYSGITEFASKIVCGKCGHVYYANNDKGRRFYNCSVKKLYTTKRCDNTNVTLEQINERISVENFKRDILEANIYFSQVFNILLFRLENSLDDEAPKKVEKLQVELEDMEKRKKRLVDIYTNGDIEENDYRQRIEPVIEKITSLKNEIVQLSKGNNEILEDIEKVKESTIRLKTDYDYFVNTNNRELLKNYTRDKIINNIKKIIVNKDGTMDIDYIIYDEYKKLIEENKHLLNIYMPNGDINKIKKEIEKIIEKSKVEIKKELNNIST